jgi:predicted RNase H-like HicB family nuclease
MQYDILLTKQPNNGYIARPILLPEIVVSGADEEEVLARVREAIAGIYANSRIVRVNVAEPDETTNDPWLRFAGMWADDPNWEQFQAHIEAFRRTIDEQTQSNSEN